MDLSINVPFSEDSLTTVSAETARQLVEIMESESLEGLIHLLLRNLAAETGVIPTSSLIAYPLRGRHSLGRS